MHILSFHVSNVDARQINFQIIILVGTEKRSVCVWSTVLEFFLFIQLISKSSIKIIRAYF